MSIRPPWLVLLASLAILPLGAGGEESMPIAVEEPPMPMAEEQPTATEPELSTPPAGADASAPLLHGTLALSLRDAIQMGLENNLDVQVERYAPMIAGFDITTAWGAYDPAFFSEIFYKDSRTPNAFVLTGVDENVNRSVEGFGGLRGVLPFLNTGYSAQFDGSRAVTNSRIQSLSPQYDSGWSLNVTQPVLRDLIWNEPWTQVRSSRLLLGGAEDDFRRAVMDEVQQIEDAYWTLIASDEALRVASKSLETAEALLGQTKTQFEVGVVSKVEVTEAEAGVSQRQVERIRAENRYRNQQDVLIDLVLGPNLRAASTLEIRPTDRPDDFVPYEVDVADAVSRAFENRPEFAQAAKEVERQEVRLSFARNQRLPALDGVFSYGQSGLSGSQNPDNDPCSFIRDPATLARCNANPRAPEFDSTQGPFRNTFDDYNASPQWTAGARLTIPFLNRVARSAASRSEVELARSRTSVHRLEQQIIIEVRQAARNLEASQEGITAARNARLAAAEQLRAEEIRLEYGESTPFDVLQREEDLVQSERGEIDAFQAYRTSVTALDRAQGTILRNRNIDIALVAPLR